jgi:hypothetical protein
MQQSKHMRNMRVLFDGPLPTALDPPTQSQPARSVGTQPRPQRVRAHAHSARHSPGNGIVALQPSEGMWLEEPQASSRGCPFSASALSARSGKSPTGLMISVPEKDILENQCHNSPENREHRCKAGKAGKMQSPCAFVGRKFAGVQTLANMFETTRLSQVAPFKVSKVKSLVREIEGPQHYRRRPRSPTHQ